ncbi:hypothetical protein [Paenibacillus naphthalenovorans]|uniref:hypothetical protein n=1 Tax=Paenibacillus naphthalenovorans TaxID=162209 RepID=UPI0008864FAA|nr:hypothetical protein [Paenibacillus naphthalenovorans]SDK01525.1 hypothetical protein SAMN05421868_1932 [Paenibacillus naphthalenovorans]
MRKSKPLVAGQIAAFGRRPVIRSLDDGVMAIPIPPEERDDAHEEMRDFIRRQKEKKQTPK